jgi:hypothetical protein
MTHDFSFTLPGMAHMMVCQGHDHFSPVADFMR